VRQGRGKLSLLRPYAPKIHLYHAGFYSRSGLVFRSLFLSNGFANFSHRLCLSRTFLRRGDPFPAPMPKKPTLLRISKDGRREPALPPPFSRRVQNRCFFLPLAPTVTPPWLPKNRSSSPLLLRITPTLFPLFSSFIKHRASPTY